MGCEEAQMRTCGPQIRREYYGRLGHPRLKTPTFQNAQGKYSHMVLVRWIRRAGHLIGLQWARLSCTHFGPARYIPSSDVAIIIHLTV